LVILDKPILKDEALEDVSIPIVYLDHHPINELEKKNLFYFNPRFENPLDDLPTSYWAYKAMHSDLWLSAIGTISDWHIPDYIHEIQKKFPDIFTKINDPGEANFNSPFGILSKSYLFAMKGKSQDTNKLIKILTRIDSPYEILNQTTSQGKLIYSHYEELNKKYQKILETASQSVEEDKFLVYIYPSSQDSFTSILSNEIVFRNQNKIIIIARIKGEKANLSLRTWLLNIPPIVSRALEGINGSGGGHKHACGAVIKSEDLHLFINNFKKYCLEELNKKQQNS
jgi:single-stranded DNA-specific DHH superfamily exonuclease